MKDQNKYFKDFCQDARYCKINEGHKPYYFRLNGQFYCSAETDDLFDQYCNAREQIKY